MLTGEDVMEIVVLRRQGLSIKEIAHRTGRSRNTVRTHLRSGAPEPVCPSRNVIVGLVGSSTAHRGPYYRHHR